MAIMNSIYYDFEAYITIKTLVNLEEFKYIKKYFNIKINELMNFQEKKKEMPPIFINDQEINQYKIDYISKINKFLITYFI